MAFWVKLLNGNKPHITQSPDISRQRVSIEHNQTPHTAPGTRITYNSHLIPRLQADHRKLLLLFTSIRSACTIDDMVEVMTCLREFKSNIQTHLITEQVQLYVYLQHTLASDQLSYALIRNMRKEMDVIGKSVLDFLEKYGTPNREGTLEASFLPDLDQLGGVLTERIEREETTLYPLYMPPMELG
jgi:hypothetical protein